MHTESLHKNDNMRPENRELNIVFQSEKITCPCLVLRWCSLLLFFVILPKCKCTIIVSADVSFNSISFTEIFHELLRNYSHFYAWSSIFRGSKLIGQTNITLNMKLRTFSPLPWDALAGLYCSQPLWACSVEFRSGGRVFPSSCHISSSLCHLFQ